MSRKVRITSIAEMEISDSIFWYDSQSSGLGSEFYNEVFELIEAIRNNPKIYKVRHFQIRVAPIKRFPFSIHYVFENNEILILSVFHNSRNPENWPK